MNNLRAIVLEKVLIFYHMILNSYTIYWIILFSLCVLGFANNPQFYGFLLLDIIDHSIALKNVIRSISLNYKQLIMTAILGIILLYFV